MRSSRSTSSSSTAVEAASLRGVNPRACRSGHRCFILAYGTPFYIAERWSDSHTTRVCHAQERTERSADANRRRHAHGADVPRLLAAGAAGRRAAGERLPAGAGEAVVRAAARVPRLQRPLRADRRVLRPSRRAALVRPQRGGGPALPLSRLEIRRDRPVHGGPVGAGRERLLPQDQAEILSAGEAWPGAVDLYGAC